ncbi:MAG: pitrilysin family protein [Gemmatimonadaceae bacterium]
MTGLLAILLLAAAGVAHAQRAPASPPPVAPPRRTTHQATVDVRFDNGLRLTMMPVRGAPVAHVVLAIRAGRLTEPLTRRGIAAVTAAYLREGSTAYSRESLADAIADLAPLGGDLSVSAGDAETLISGTVLPEEAPALVRLLASLVAEPAFPASALERLTDSEADRVSSENVQPATRASSLADSLLGFDERVWSPPRALALRALTRDDVVAFWRRAYRPSAAQLYVSGVYDAAAIREVAERAFSSWRDTATGLVPVASEAPDAPARAGTGLVIHLVDRPGATQARVVVGYRTVDPSHPDFTPLQVLHNVLGSVQSSRIVASVRERHGYSYNVSSGLLARPSSSRWTVSADIANAAVSPALREILAEIERMSRDGVGGDELASFQTLLVGDLTIENATPEGRVRTLRRIALFRGDPAYLDTFAERIFAVTPSQLQSVARKYLAPSRAVIVVVGDRKQIEPSLAALGVVAPIR